MLIKNRTIHDQRALYFFISAHTMMLFLLWQRGFGALPGSLIMFLNVLSVIFLFASFFIFIKYRVKLLFSIGSIKIKLSLLLIFFVIMSISGAIRYSEVYAEIPRQALASFLIDFASWGYLVSPIVLLSLKEYELKRFLIYCFTISIAMMATTIQYFDFSTVIAAEYRRVSYDTMADSGIPIMPMFHEGMVPQLFIIASMCFSCARNSFITLIFSCFAIFWAFLCSSYYSRRGSLIDLAVFSVFFILVSINSSDSRLIKIKLSKKILFFRSTILLALGGFLVIQDYQIIDIGIDISDYITLLQRVINRFNNVSYFENLDRVFEFKELMKQLSFWEMLTGRGLGALADRTGEIAGAFHLGYSNFILKGGFPFLIFICLSLLSNFLVVYRYRKCYQSTFVLFISIYALYKISVSPMWSLNVSGFILGIAFFAPEIFILGRVR